MARGDARSPRARHVRFEKTPDEARDVPAAPGSPTAKEWMPVPARQAYLDRVATADTTEALDAVRRDARRRYLVPSLGDLFAAVDHRRRELER